MSKLSTGELKRLIVEEWMTDEVMETVKQQYGLDKAFRKDDERARSYYSQFDLTSLDQVDMFFIKEMRIPQNWLRDHKEKLDDLGDYEDFDIAGKINEALFAEHKHKGAGCWNRIFIPRHGQLCDSFRLEIITDPSDEKVVMWTLIVD